MARRRLITDEELLEHLNNYIVNFCDGRSDTVKIPEFGTYLRKNGFPKVQDYLIRRNITIRKYLNDERERGTISNRHTLSTYRTLDVDLFIKTAIEKMEEYKTKLTKLEKENLEISVDNKKLKSLNKSLTSLIKSYKTIIETYVYPEIANELLMEDMLINETQKIINSEILSEKIITAQTPIKSESKIIQGLFADLER